MALADGRRAECAARDPRKTGPRHWQLHQALTLVKLNGAWPASHPGRRGRWGMSDYQFDRLKVLVVDDNVHMRKLVTTILQAFGVTQILEADSGERAWAVLRESNPDVIILDWVMEGMSGVELIRMIRTNPQAPNPFVPVIMLTGHTSLEYVRQARDAGSNEFIVKPVSVKTMMSRLVAVIEHPRPYVRTVSFFGPCRRRRNTNEYHGPERRSEAPRQAAE